MKFVGSIHGKSALLVAAIILAGCFRPSEALAQGDLPTFDLTLSEDNYESWRDHVLPNPVELDWQKIPWLTTFKDGILAADDADKPLLLWTMNGHPLGCT